MDKTIETYAVKPEQAAALLGISKSLFYKLKNSGRIPLNPIRLTKKVVLYSREEIREYVRAGMPRDWKQNTE